jgi:PilZ domain-containing protein
MPSAGSTVTTMVSREHRRVRMHLPVRLRWTTPFGQKIELCETVDVSRGGLLLCSGEFHHVGMALWATFPYDASLPDGQPEVPARVVRCITFPEDGLVAGPREKVSGQTSSARERSAGLQGLERGIGPSEASPKFALAIQFEGSPRATSNGNQIRHDPERRGSLRRSLAVPIRVRPDHVPWFEEAMTLDFSLQGMRFRSQREYAAGEPLRIALEDAASTLWSGTGEFRANVVRVSPAADGVALDVSVCRAI